MKLTSNCGWYMLESLLANFGMETATNTMSKQDARYSSSTSPFKNRTILRLEGYCTCFYANISWFKDKFANANDHFILGTLFFVAKLHYRSTFLSVRNTIRETWFSQLLIKICTLIIFEYLVNYLLSPLFTLERKLWINRSSSRKRKVGVKGVDRVYCYISPLRVSPY